MAKHDRKYKVRPEHHEALVWRMRAILASIPGSVAAQYREQGLSPKRLRWDLLHASGVRLCDENTVPPNTEPVLMHSGAYTNGRGVFFVPVYDYADDSHVDSVLRGIMRDQAAEWGLESWAWAAKQ